MPKKYNLKLRGGMEPQEMEIYAGQIWVGETLSEYRKIVTLSKLKDRRLRVKYEERNGDGKNEKTEGIDDFVMWAATKHASPMIVEYEEYETENGNTQ